MALMILFHVCILLQSSSDLEDEKTPLRELRFNMKRLLDISSKEIVRLESDSRSVNSELRSLQSERSTVETALHERELRERAHRYFLHNTPTPVACLCSQTSFAQFSFLSTMLQR